MSVFDEIFAPDMYLGICDECQQAKTFPTQHERDQWERHHPHGENS